MKRILLTNDDGIHSPGLDQLARAVSKLGDVTVVAPDRERSACSQSLTLHDPIRLEELEAGRYAVNGTPADCVVMALNHLLPCFPDLVISGINRGPNLGHDIGYSGTVAGALEAANYQIPAFAVSTALASLQGYAAAAGFAALLAEALLADPPEPGLIFNVNVPAQEAKGIRVTRQGHRNMRNIVVENRDPRGRTYYWIDQELQQELHLLPQDYDYVAVSQGYISVTPIKADRTAEGWLERASLMTAGLSKQLLPS
ncbi:MAG: 5'/3'-nucleotidase SurE [Acidobacteriota bacterium]